MTNQVHEHLSVHLDQLRETGRLEVHMNLDPPELARSAHLTVEDGHLSVRFLVQNDGAKNALDAQLEPLRAVCGNGALP